MYYNQNKIKTSPFFKSKYMKMCAVKLKEKRTKISKKY